MSDELHIDHKDGVTRIMLNGMELSKRAVRVQAVFEPLKKPKLRVDFFKPWRNSVLDRISAAYMRRKIRKHLFD